MPVQIPKLNRFEPQQTQSVGRSEVQAPNLAAIAQPQMNAVMGIAEQQTAYFQKQEDNAIDTAAKAAANEYNVYLNQELTKARTFKGDPTAIYNQFDEARAKKYDEIVNKNPDISSRGKRAIEGSLGEVATSYQIKRDTAYYGQYYDYDLGVTRDSGKLASQDIPNLAGFVNPADENSFKPIDAMISRIGNLWKQHGEKFGAIETDEFGNTVPSKHLQLEMGEQVSKGLVDSINTLNASGHPEIAEAIYAKYSKYIDEFKKDNLSKTIKDTATDIKIENLAAQSVGKSPEAVTKMIDKAFADKPEAKKKAYAAIDSRQRELENMKTRQENKNFKYLANQLYNRQNSDSPFTKVYDMEKDPIYKAILPTLSPEDRKKLRNIIESPKESNPKYVLKYLNAVKSGALAGMSPEDFVDLKGGLNKQQGNQAETLWKKLNPAKGSPEQIKGMKDLMADLDEQLLNVGYVKKIKLDDGRTVGYSEKDQNKITESINELTAKLDTLPPNLSYGDRKKILIEFAAKKKAAEAYTEHSSWGFFGSSEKPKTTESPFAKSETLDDRKTKEESVRRFVKKNKRAPLNSKELEDFLKNENN